MEKIVSILFSIFISKSFQQFTMTKFEAKQVYTGTANVVKISAGKRYTKIIIKKL